MASGLLTTGCMTTPVNRSGRWNHLFTISLAVLPALVTGAWAQDAKTADEAVKMEKFEVSGVPIEQQILPTSRPFNSVFGTDDNIVDVPRNVTIISRQQLTAISISDVLDFS